MRQALEHKTCLCGCGEETAIVEKTRTDRGLKIGDHYKYVKGHATTNKQLGEDVAWQQKLTPYELGWVVGLFEGEGTIGLKKRIGKHGISYYPSVSITGTDEDTINNLYKLIPDGNMCMENRETLTGKKVYRWTLSKSKYVIDFLITIRLLVSTRRKLRIDEVLENAAYTRN